MTIGPTYDVRLSDAAARSLRKLPRDARAKLNAKLLTLAANPRPHGSKKLKGANDLHRIRSGNYRILYSIEDNKLIVYIVAIGDRKDVYEGL